MIRQALTTLLCSVTFFLIAFVIPADAGHTPAAIPYVCTSLDDAMETVRLQIAEDMETLSRKGHEDEDFKCYFLDPREPFFVLKLEYAYTAYGVQKGVALVRSFDGWLGYTFGTMQFINQILHQEGA